MINQIPPHDTFVEAFLGDGAIMRKKLPARRTIGVEIDPEVAHRFDANADGLDVEVHNCCGIEWLKHTFGLYRIPRPPTPNPATWPARNGDRLPRHFAAAAVVARSSGADLQDRAGGSPDARSSVVGPSWFVYCDPPYLLSTRRSGRIYRYEMTEAHHIDLLGVIKRLPCHVAISGYYSPLYAEALQDWRCIAFNAITRGQVFGREHLWMNYPAPAELHDYRYLGGNRRERERITRKVRTWSAGLARLPRLERQAILRSLDPAAGFGDAADRPRVTQD